MIEADDGRASLMSHEVDPRLQLLCPVQEVGEGNMKLLGHAL